MSRKPFDLRHATQHLGILPDQFDDFVEQLAERHDPLPPQVEQARIVRIAHRPPAVLVDQQRRIRAPVLVVTAQPVEPADQAQVQRRQPHRVLERRARVHDPRLERRVARAQAHVPPDPRGVDDHARLDQRVHVATVFAVARKRFRQPRARNAVEDHQAERHQSRALAFPERRAAREREQVRQEIPRLVQQVDAQLVVVDADVHVQAADHHAPRHALHFLEQRDVTLLVGALLLRRQRERVRARGDRREAVARGFLHQDATQVDQRRAGVAHRAADRRRDLDLRAQELRECPAVAAVVQRGEQLVRRLARDRTRLAVDQEELLLDAERQRGLEVRHAAGSASSSSRAMRVGQDLQRSPAPGGAPSAPPRPGNRPGRGAPRCRCAAAGALGVMIDREIGRVLAAVGLVVADDQALLRRSPASRRRAFGSSSSQSTPTCQGRSAPAVPRRGTKLCTAMSSGTTCRAWKPREHRGDALVVRVEERAQAQAALVFGQALVAGNRPAVAFGAERLEIVRAAVAVDDEPRITGHHGGCVQGMGQAARQLAGPHVPGDVLPAGQFGQPEPAQGAAGSPGSRDRRRSAPGPCRALRARRTAPDHPFRSMGYVRVLTGRLSSRRDEFTRGRHF